MSFRRADASANLIRLAKNPTFQTIVLAVPLTLGIWVTMVVALGLFQTFLPSAMSHGLRWSEAWGPLIGLFGAAGAWAAVWVGYATMRSGQNEAKAQRHEDRKQQRLATETAHTTTCALAVMAVSRSIEVLPEPADVTPKQYRAALVRAGDQLVRFHQLGYLKWIAVNHHEANWTDVMQAASEWLEHVGNFAKYVLYAIDDKPVDEQTEWVLTAHHRMQVALDLLTTLSTGTALDDLLGTFTNKDGYWTAMNIYDARRVHEPVDKNRAPELMWPDCVKPITEVDFSGPNLPRL